jgi:hypothetical protein
MGQGVSPFVSTMTNSFQAQQLRRSRQNERVLSKKARKVGNDGGSRRCPPKIKKKKMYH